MARRDAEGNTIPLTMDFNINEKVFAGKLSVASQEISEKLSITDSVEQVEDVVKEVEEDSTGRRGFEEEEGLMEGGNPKKKNI
ncbi:Hypothetical protein FKW44_014196 [Caligus rogercresseyi]|uniref:Uncharacterized protein n=1 Tax=Caligus rogercresseyi TaxID=217165 RepID=A0A7T8GYK3_CALRO|nr:Hypothetical protein FKW44_014196 [Caligus rogercresseyi]